MSHVRQQIRDRIATTLTGLTTTGSNVYKMRRYALDDNKLPAVLVYTMDEAATLSTIGNRTYHRDLSVAVEGVCSGASTSAFDTIDTIAAEIETAMANDFTLNGLAKSAILNSAEVNVTVEGEKTLCSVRMIYIVRYVTGIVDPETAL